jgi:plastocyanin
MPPLQRSLLPLLASVLLLATAAEAAELTGTVQLEKRGRAQKVDSESRVIVYFVPDGDTAAKAPSKPFVLTTEGKEFKPRNLVVPVGSTVQFPNEDTILHNVFSVSGRNHFDLGLYRQGPGKNVTFQHSGVVRVFCNVHHSMVAWVVVADTPHVTYADDNGRFRLTGLPNGPGTLTAWYERSDPVSQSVRLPTSGPVELILEVSKPKLPKHKDKDGRSYRRRERYH